MIKNNVFNILWFMVAGIVVSNAPYIYGAEQSITSSNKLMIPNIHREEPSKISMFINELAKVKASCTQGYTKDCNLLNDLINSNILSKNGCKKILEKDGVGEDNKTLFADTYMAIKYDPQLTNAKNLEIPEEIEPYLSGNNLLSLAFKKNDPNKWTTSNLSKSDEALQSIDAIKMISSGLKKYGEPDNKENFAANILGYLKIIRAGLTSEKVTNDLEKHLEAFKDVINFAVSLDTTKSNDIKRTCNLLLEQIDLPIIHFIRPPQPMNTAKQQSGIINPTPIPSVAPKQPLASTILTPEEIQTVNDLYIADTTNGILNGMKNIITTLSKDPLNENDKQKIAQNYITISMDWESRRKDPQIFFILKKIIDNELFKDIPQMAFDKAVFNKPAVNNLSNYLSNLMNPEEAPQSSALTLNVASQQKPITTTVAKVHALQQVYREPSGTNQQQKASLDDFLLNSKVQLPVEHKTTTYKSSTPVNVPASETQPSSSARISSVQDSSESKPIGANIPMPTSLLQPAVPEYLVNNPEKRRKEHDELERNMDIVNKKIAANQKITQGDISNIEQHINSMRGIDKFKIDYLNQYLSENLKIKLPVLELPKSYNTVFTEEEIIALSTSGMSLESVSPVNEINIFIEHGCKNNDVDKFITQVIQLARDQNSNLAEYKKTIINNRVFETVCNFIINGADRPNKQEFEAAYNNKLQLEKQPIVNKQMAPVMNPVPSSKISVVPGEKQPVIPTVPVQQLAQKNIATEIPAQLNQPVKTATEMPNVNNQNQQSVAPTGETEQEQAKTPTGSWLRGIGSGLWKIGSEIVWFFSSIPGWISSFFTPSK